MAEPQRPDEAVAEELLHLLRDEEPQAPDDLPERTLRKVRASITTRDLIDLTTVVFILRFCAPIIDLIASLFGATPSPPDRRADDDE